MRLSMQVFIFLLQRKRIDQLNFMILVRLYGLHILLNGSFLVFQFDKCFEQLLKMQKIIEDQGKIEGTIHRYLIAAKK